MKFERLMRRLPLADIRLKDEFWNHWQDRVFGTTLEIQYQKCLETGRLENFRRATRGEHGTYEGYCFNDSDIYKWLEAASYALMVRPDPKIRARIDEAVSIVAAAQMPDGYLNTFFQVNWPDRRWKALNWAHEMYCGGHLLEAAAAHHEATGTDDLLNVAIRFADHVRSEFGPDKRLGYCGHEEFELGLLALANAVGGEKGEGYREFARWMIDVRGTKPSIFEAELADPVSKEPNPWKFSLLQTWDGKYDGSYAQDHVPLREQTDVVGHAVRAMYLFAAAAEAFAGRGDEAMVSALERLWNSLVERRMYVTGGIGSTQNNEGFTSDYDLPNRTAYTETCASCGLVFWAERMLAATGDSCYADVLEIALYNGALPGISLSGDRFFYANPLETAGDKTRPEWYDCACCPPNIARLIASVGRVCASQSDDGVWIHMPVSMDVAWNGVTVEVRSEYPWDGKTRLTVRTPQPKEFALRVRIPAWCPNLEIEQPDDAPELEHDGGYAIARRVWHEGDVLELAYEMPAQWLASDPRVLDNNGKVALQRGPFVYCLEELDAGAMPQFCDVDPTAEVETGEPMPVLGGAVPLTVWGRKPIGPWREPLYGSADSVELQPVEFRFVPFYAWNNRGPGAMQVWVRRND